MFAKCALYSACTVDKLSCECCKMVAETKRLKTYFDSTLTHLEMELEKANKSFATLKGEGHIL